MFDCYYHLKTCFYNRKGAKRVKNATVISDSSLAERPHKSNIRYFVFKILLPGHRCGIVDIFIFDVLVRISRDDVRISSGMALNTLWHTFFM